MAEKFNARLCRNLLKERHTNDTNWYCYLCVSEVRSYKLSGKKTLTRDKSTIFSNLYDISLLLANWSVGV